MYQAHLINPLQQLGRISFDVVLFDEVDGLPEIRLSKDFCSTCDRTTINQKINEMIASVLEGRFLTGLDSELRTQDTIEATIDLPEGVVID
jgi:hypothetical protein